MQQIFPMWAESDHLCCVLQFDSDFFSNFNTAFNNIASGSGNVNSVGSGNQGAFASGSGNQNAFAAGTNNAVASAVSGPGKKRKEKNKKTTPFGIVFVRGQVLYRAAQVVRITCRST
jgi:hypothetical protein